jgi:thiosulfate/3-mercaptopyruvate sulfurtransferase
MIARTECRSFPRSFERWQRPPDACDKTHIPGARRILLREIAVTRDGIPNEMPPDAELQRVFARAGVGNGSRVVLYGERFNLLAARAYFTLDYLGVAGNAALLDGGLEKWKAEGRPLTAEAPRARPPALAISPRPETLVDTARVKALAAQPHGAVLIDAVSFQEPWSAGAPACVQRLMESLCPLWCRFL